MKKFLLVLLCLPVFLFAQSQRQTTYAAIPDCFVQSFIPVSGGGSLLAGHSKYGTDSCLMNMVFMNDSDVIISHKEFNTATNFDFVSQVVPAGSGYLIGGKSSDPSFFHPQLVRTDASGNVLWAKYFNNTSSWQGQIIRIIPNGTAFSMYTFAETPFNDFYRIDGDASGNTFTGFQYMPDTAMSFRVFDAERMGNSSSHILSGHANFNSSSTRGGLMMKTTPAGVQWCKQVTAGGNFKNDIVDVAAGEDGNSYSVFVCENMPGNQYSTVILKLDSLGNKVWAKQLALSSGTLNGCSIIESASHDFYVATYDNLFIAYITRLDAAGNLIWTHKWTPSATGGASALKLFKDAANNIVFTGMLDNSYFVARLDANAGGCSFTNSTAISLTTANPVLTPITFSTTPFTPAAVNESIVYSALVYSENMICGGVGIEEEQGEHSLRIYPNPATEKITIHSRPMGIGITNETTTEISVYNMLGEAVLAVTPLSFGEGLGGEADVSSLTPGVYFLQVYTGEKIYRGKFIKE